MDFLRGMIANVVIVAPFVGWAVAQICKGLLYFVINKKFVLERMIGFGGMPSSHSATVCALATTAGMIYGPLSFEFAIAFVFALMTMNDAMGVRKQTENQSRIINAITDMLERTGEKIGAGEKLKEFVGHTPIQVIAGAIIGIATGVVLCHLM